MQTYPHTYTHHRRTHSGLSPSLPAAKYKQGVVRAKGTGYLDISKRPHVLLALWTSGRLAEASFSLQLPPSGDV